MEEKRIRREEDGKTGRSSEKRNGRYEDWKRRELEKRRGEEKRIGREENRREEDLKGIRLKTMVGKKR